jgi:Fic family protein
MNNLKIAIRLKAELDALRPIAPEHERRVMQKLRLDWNYHSNHLEGNSLTYGETKALILHGITAQGKPLKDHTEVEGHNEAIQWIYEIAQDDRPLTETFIRELHTTLLVKPYKVPAEPKNGIPTWKLIQVGRYKNSDNYVLTATGERQDFLPFQETPRAMQELVDWYALEKVKPEINPILLATQFHHKFINIHPFDDGNGRVVRLLMNYILLQFAYPPIIIKTEDKTAYFSALQAASAGNIEPFFEFIINNLILSLELIIKGARGESVEDPDDLDKELALLEQKFSSQNTKFDTVKNVKSIQIIVTEVIIKILKQLEVINKKFERFYIDKLETIECFYDYGNYGDENVLSFFEFYHLNEINFDSNLVSISIKSNFSKFKYIGLEHNYFIGEINCRFDEVKYSIEIKNQIIDKRYDEVLTDDEVYTIVLNFSALHKETLKNYTHREILKNHTRGKKYEVGDDIPF